uniref:Uncharacterized protein n=1 Tax=Populus trichocarpa TaxID=3694 RepID=A0A2K2BQY2_POPTR|eukprot:XP_002297786.3 UPF0481 protein At3g47200 [Populus trichocarpa]
MSHWTEIAVTSTDQLMNKGDHVSVDTNKLATSMQEEFNKLRPFSDKCSIYRVPKRLLKLNRSAYTPQVVSIGPLHHGKTELQEMEEHKKMYLQDFLKFSKVSLEDLIAFVAEKETRLRNCYAETFEKLSSEQFVKMMLLDCSFVIMVLLRTYDENIGCRNDRIFSKPWMFNDVSKDMCLLENQLPFFILDDLIKLSKKRDPISLIGLTFVFLTRRWPEWVPQDLEEIEFCDAEHFVAFLRICQQPTEQKQQKEIDTISTPSAMDLHQAGVRFKLGSSQKLLDIKFDADKGTLEIPCLKIVDSTETLFRNVQAFEQCHSDSGYIGNYITMINLVVQASKDTEILARKGITENWLRDNDALLSLLHNLSKENFVDTDDFYFSDVVEHLNKYYSRRRHKWKAALEQKYFDNPWTIISVIAAGILLLLTVIQAVCSIIQVV